MLGLKLNHVSKRGPRASANSTLNLDGRNQALIMLPFNTDLKHHRAVVTWQGNIVNGWNLVNEEYVNMYVCMSAGIQSAGHLVPETLGSNPAFSRGRQLVCFGFDVSALKLTPTMYIARARRETISAVGSSGLNAHWSKAQAIELKF